MDNRKKFLPVEIPDICEYFRQNPMIKYTMSATQPKKWKDQDIDLYPGVSYTTIEKITTLRRLGENWLIMLYQGDQYRLSEVTTLLALHIKAPDLKTNLCRPDDQQEPNSPLKKNLDEIVGIEELEKMEELTGRKEASQYIDEKAGIIGNLVLDKEPLRRISQDPSITQFSQAAAGLTVASASGSNFETVINIFRKESVEKAAAFYCFAAAVVARLIVKEESKIAVVFSRGMSKRFGQFYGPTATPIFISPPRITALKTIKFMLRPKIPLCIGLLKGFLKALIRANAPREEGKSILDYTLLLHTSMNGLQLVNLMMQAKNKIEAESFEEIMELVYCDATEHGIGLLKHFIQEYIMVTEEEASPYVLWARLFNDAYFIDLRIADNSLLAAMFIAMITDDPEDAMWRMPSLKISAYEKACILEKANSWKANKQH